MAERSIFLFLSALLFSASFVQPGLGQELSGSLKDTIDLAISEAYQSASVKFPCKLKSRGKPKMLRWETVDRCLNDAVERVDWEALSIRLKSLQAGVRSIGDDDIRKTVEVSLSSHAVPYDRVFAVSAKDSKALLPLTNSLLKYLPEESLLNAPVFEKAGEQVGIFSGTYVYESTGGLASANTYRLALFQYEDRNGNMQSSSDKLLLDSFGIPWEEALRNGSFRLNSDKIFPKR